MSRFSKLGGAVAVVMVLGGCGPNLGDSCDTDADCSDGLTCLSPGCIGDLSCQYACSGDDECASSAGEGSTCNTDDPFDSCIGYCSAAD